MDNSVVTERESTDRRTFLKRAALASAVATVGVPAFTGTAAARECCKVCWIDVKPDSCPNAINPNNNGVVSVAVGWPYVLFETARLVPLKSGPMSVSGCQNYRHPDWHVSCADLTERLAAADGRSASAVRKTVEDINGDGTRDTVFKFDTRDLELEPDDEFLLFVGETGSGCQLLGIDSIRVVGGSNGNVNARRNANAKGRKK
jgi:hypothetical protein